MTLGQWWYRRIYLNSLGWKLTRLLRKRRYCEECGTVYDLHLHHVSYSGYFWWNLLLPDLISFMRTLCARHHKSEHKR